MPLDMEAGLGPGDFVLEMGTSFTQKIGKIGTNRKLIYMTSY